MLRLIPGSILLLTALLCVFKAPTNFTWRLQVAVTNYPHLFILTALALFFSCFLLDKYKAICFVLSGISIVLFCIPIINAYKRASNLNLQLLSYFPGCESGVDEMPKPFSPGVLFTGLNYENITPQSLVYKSIGNRSWSLDYYPAKTTSPAPCVVVIHGGAWSGGDNKEIPELNSYLAQRGYNVASIDYRLAPEFKSPSPVEDTRDAIQFLKSRAQQMNIDTANFVLLGRSAGGQIALCAAYTMGKDVIKGVVSFYAPADMVWGASIKGNPLVLNTDSTFAAYLGGPYEQFADKYHESSAVELASENSPATLLIHGDNDCMVSVEHAKHLMAKLDSFHVAHFFLDLPGATHACDYNLSGPYGQLSTYTIERFIASAVRN